MASNKEVRLKAGDILFAQGDQPDGLYMLENGAVEILAASDEYSGLDRTIVVSKSVRVGLLKGKILLAGFSEGLSGPNRKSVRAAEDCLFSKYALVNGGIRAIAQSDPNLAMTVIKHLCQLTGYFSQSVARFGKLYTTACMIADNMAIIYKVLSETNAADSLHSRAESIYTKYRAGGGPDTGQYDAKFLVTDNSRFLKKRYELPALPQESPAAAKMNDFMDRLFGQSAMANALKGDPLIAAAAYDMQSEDLLRTMERLEALQNAVNDVLGQIFGERGSWTQYLTDSRGFDEWQRNGKLAKDFVQGLLSLVSKINALYEEMAGKKITVVFPAIKKIHEYYSSGQTDKAEKAAPAGGGAAPAVVSSGATSKSLHQIMEFSVMDKEFQGKFVKLLKEFTSMKDPFNTEQEGRKLRRHITKFYWEMYKQAFLRSKTESVVPKPVQMMIRFGFIDETMVEPGQLEELNELVRLQERTSQVPIYYESDFLSLIMEGKMEPSITEMGLTFDEFLREQEKTKSSKDKGPKVKDEGISKMLYEIDQRVVSTAAVCSGSTATAFPILTSLAVKGSLKTLYTDKKKVEDIILETRDIDYSLFYRETVLKLGEARELIMEEILPNIILIPILGAKTLLWQELVGTNRRTKGRLVVPILFMGDLKRRLIHSLACFRWELNKTLKGAMWADPIEGGVTGEYFDYVNTYKKMSKLSQEAKDKISERFKALRTNRDRFADDYIQWVVYEKDGIMRQNNIVREMFFKHIPFKKEIRDKLEGMPAFAHAANRYKNVAVRNYQAYERRFKKYQDEAGEYPPEIQKFFEFLKK